jgi:hypothetical protein
MRQRSLGALDMQLSSFEPEATSNFPTSALGH